MFNYQARWDRELPQEEIDKFGPGISVLCLMHDKKISPRSFCFKNNTYTVQKINFCWKDRRGKENISFFSVKTEKGTFQISFSHQSLAWHLNKLLGP